MRTLLLVSLLAACSHPTPSTAPRPAAPHAQLSAKVQAWLDHGTEPTLSVVFVITDDARALVRELGLQLDGDYGGELAATVTRAQLVRLAASPAVIDLRRNYAVGLPPAALVGDASWWLQEDAILGDCQPKNGDAAVYIEIDHAPTAADHAVLAAAGVIVGDEPRISYLFEARLTRQAAADIVRGIAGVRLSISPCVQLYGDQNERPIARPM